MRIISVSFERDGVAIQYVLETSVRKKGALQQLSTMFIGLHPDYEDDIDDVKSKVQELLRDALEDYLTAEVVDPESDDDDDGDEMGMGFP